MYVQSLITAVSCTSSDLCYSGCFSFPNPPNMKIPVRAIATIVFPRGMWITNAINKEIATPTRLNGSLFLIARENLPKLCTAIINSSIDPV